MKGKASISDFMLDLYHLDALSKKERKSVDEELATNSELSMRYQHILESDKEIRNHFSLENLTASTNFLGKNTLVPRAIHSTDEAKSNQKHKPKDEHLLVSDFMLDLYHLDALSKKERKLIELELSRNEELQNRYQDIQKADEEIRSRIYSDNPAKLSGIKVESSSHIGLNRLFEEMLGKKLPDTNRRAEIFSQYCNGIRTPTLAKVKVA